MPKLLKLWRKTEDAFCHEPRFKVTCIHCGDEMMLRHTTIVLGVKEKPVMNAVAYKCSTCAWFITFQVEDSARYLKKVWKEYRDGNLKLVPTEKWVENEKIAKKLKSLGYFGG